MLDSISDVKLTQEVISQITENLKQSHENFIMVFLIYILYMDMDRLTRIDLRGQMTRMCERDADKDQS